MKCCGRRKGALKVKKWKKKEPAVSDGIKPFSDFTAKTLHNANVKVEKTPGVEEMRRRLGLADDGRFSDEETVLLWMSRAVLFPNAKESEREEINDDESESDEKAEAPQEKPGEDAEEQVLGVIMPEFAQQKEKLDAIKAYVAQHGLSIAQQQDGELNEAQQEILLKLLRATRRHPNASAPPNEQEGEREGQEEGEQTPKEDEANPTPLNNALRLVVKGSHAAGKWAQMCGLIEEGHEDFTPGIQTLAQVVGAGSDEVVGLASVEANKDSQQADIGVVFADNKAVQKREPHALDFFGLGSVQTGLGSLFSARSEEELDEEAELSEMVKHGIRNRLKAFGVYYEDGAFDALGSRIANPKAIPLLHDILAAEMLRIRRDPKRVDGLALDNESFAREVADQVMGREDSMFGFV